MGPAADAIDRVVVAGRLSSPDLGRPGKPGLVQRARPSVEADPESAHGVLGPTGPLQEGRQPLDALGFSTDDGHRDLGPGRRPRSLNPPGLGLPAVPAGARPGTPSHPTSGDAQNPHHHWPETLWRRG